MKTRALHSNELIYEESQWQCRARLVDVCVCVCVCALVQSGLFLYIFFLMNTFKAVHRVESHWASGGEGRKEVPAKFEGRELKNRGPSFVKAVETFDAAEGNSQWSHAHRDQLQPPSTKCWIIIFNQHFFFHPSCCCLSHGCVGVGGSTQKPTWLQVAKEEQAIYFNSKTKEKVSSRVGIKQTRNRGT